MAEIRRFLMLCVLMLGTLGIGLAAAGNLPSLSGPTSYAVPDILDERPLGEEVVVSGQVTAVKEDHVTESGNTYQQFHIGTEEASVLVFCSTYNGRTDVSVGEDVTVRGTFQEFYGTDEIKAECADVKLATADNAG